MFKRAIYHVQRIALPLVHPDLHYVLQTKKVLFLFALHERYVRPFLIK